MSIIESFPKGSSSKVNINYQFAPIGTIISLMGKSAPEGYLICDGSYYDIDTYKNLADYFQSQFGSANYFGGNGTTTFAVPDLRGEFLRGAGTNNHENQGDGSSVGEHQDSTEVPSLYGGNGTNNQIGIAKTDSRWSYANMGTKQKFDKIIANPGQMLHIGGTTPYSTDAKVGTIRPTNTSILWCIKATETNDIQATNYVYGYTPVGTIITMSGQCPQDFHECDGSILNISEYPELAEYYKESFGSYDYYGGNGTTTFGIPDLRGEFIRGTGTNSHENQGSGANIGVHQDSTEIEYYYLANTDNSLNLQFDNTNGFSSPRNHDSITLYATKALELVRGNLVNKDGTGKALVTIRPTNTSVLFCVALKNIIPVESSESEETTGGHIISDNGTELDEQPVLNFTDFDIENDTENNETDIKTHRLTEEELNEIFDEQPNILGITPNIGFTPVGTIISVMGNTAPSNYLACDGTEVLIMEYPDLAKYFEEQFGTKNHFGGDGTTTFAVPDLRGEFLRGTGTNSHINQGSGANVGTHQDATEQPRIYYQFNGYLVQYAGPTSSGTYDIQYKNVDSGIQAFNTTLKQDFYRSSSTGTNYNADTHITSRPTNTSVLYCIAVKNIYIDPKYDYSTYEKVVGTWIDGKPIYQKTISCGSGPNKTTKEVAHNISNFGTLIHQEYRLTLGDGNQLTMTNFHGSDKIFAEATATAGYINYAIQASVNATNIRIMARDVDYSAMTNIYATLQYTKTTD